MYFDIGFIVFVMGILALVYIWISTLIRWSAGYIKDVKENNLADCLPKRLSRYLGLGDITDPAMATALCVLIWTLSIFAWLPGLVILAYIGVLRLLRHLLQYNLHRRATRRLRKPQTQKEKV